MILGLSIVFLLYLLTVFIGWYGLRKELIKKGWEPDGIVVSVIFIPFMNVIWGVSAWIDSSDKSKLRRFFRMD